MTDQQKGPELVAASVEAIHIKFIRAHLNSLTPRLKRLLRALLDNPAGLSREQVDHVTPCSNGPEYARQLHERLGLNLVPCERISFTTIDGVSSWYGLYRLTPSDRKKLLAALS